MDVARMHIKRSRLSGWCQQWNILLPCFICNIQHIQPPCYSPLTVASLLPALALNNDLWCKSCTAESSNVNVNPILLLQNVAGATNKSLPNGTKQEEHEQTETRYKAGKLRNRVSHRKKEQLQRWYGIQTWPHTYYPVLPNSCPGSAECAGEACELWSDFCCWTVAQCNKQV